MKEPLFTGACTALVTPFLDGNINYPMLEVLLRRQIDAGIRAVVVCGTTGESATLTDREKLEIIHRSKQFTQGHLHIVAGTGSNDTSHTVAMSKAAEEAGADSLLVVSPYYNKATPDGLYNHFLAVASSVSVPIILYNVPSRTGVDIPVDVYQQLSKIPNIAGVKEASNDFLKIAKIRTACPDDFFIWAGNDELTVPTISIGGKGVISVLSNLYPTETDSMVQAALDGDFDTAAALQLELFPLTQALFSEVNPVPVKAAMKLLGYDCGFCRLPLTAASPETIKLLSTHLI